MNQRCNLLKQPVELLLLLLTAEYVLPVTGSFVIDDLKVAALVPECNVRMVIGRTDKDSRNFYVGMLWKQPTIVGN